MADTLIIDSTTRIIRGLTSDSSPVLSPNEITVVMPSQVILPTTGRYSIKLDVDNLTIIPSTAQDINTYMDIIDPKRITMRNLVSKLTTVSTNTNLPLGIRDFAVAFLNHLS